MDVNFDLSIDIFSKEYKECINSNNPKYLRSIPADSSPKQFMQFCKTLYEKNNFSEIKTTKSKIPKIIHQIWLGPKVPPHEYQTFQKSWKDKHLTWQHISWNEEEIKKQFPEKLFNQKLFNHAKKQGNFAKMADIARYEIIHKFGGLYVDCDCECIKPFDVLHQNYDFYSGLEHLQNGLVVGNALIGAKPNHPILHQCLLNIKEYEKKQKIDLHYWKGFSGYCAKVEKQYALTLTTTGPILFTKSIWQKADKDNNIDIIFPPTFFFPFPEYGAYTTKQETFSCHYFKGIWKKDLLEKYNKHKIGELR